MDKWIHTILMRISFSIFCWGPVKSTSEHYPTQQHGFVFLEMLPPLNRIWNIKPLSFLWFKTNLLVECSCSWKETTSLHTKVTKVLQLVSPTASNVGNSWKFPDFAAEHDGEETSIQSAAQAQLPGGLVDSQVGSNPAFGLAISMWSPHLGGFWTKVLQTFETTKQSCWYPRGFLAKSTMFTD